MDIILITTIDKHSYCTVPSEYVVFIVYWLVDHFCFDTNNSEWNYTLQSCILGWRSWRHWPCVTIKGCLLNVLRQQQPLRCPIYVLFACRALFSWHLWRLAKYLAYCHWSSLSSCFVITTFLLWWLITGKDYQSPWSEVTSWRCPKCPPFTWLECLTSPLATFSNQDNLRLSGSTWGLFLDNVHALKLLKSTTDSSNVNSVR